MALELFGESGREVGRSRVRAGKRGRGCGGDFVDGDSRACASKYVAALARRTLFVFDGLMGAAQPHLPPVQVFFGGELAVPF